VIAWNGKLLWGRLTHSRVLGILANPSYAGTYVFGRYQACKQIGPTGEVRTQSCLKAQDQWRVVIQIQSPALGSADFSVRLVLRQRMSSSPTASRTGAAAAMDRVWHPLDPDKHVRSCDVSHQSHPSLNGHIMILVVRPPREHGVEPLIRDLDFEALIGDKAFDNNLLRQLQ
jgi:hypothetical protein